MSLLIITFVGAWGLLLWAALTLARDRLSPPEGERAPLRAVLLCRGTAFLAATFLLAALELLLGLVLAPAPALRAVALSWAFAVAPLLAPPLGRPGARIHLSHGSLILSSLLLTVAAAVALALFLLVSLLAQAPALL